MYSLLKSDIFDRIELGSFNVFWFVSCDIDESDILLFIIRMMMANKRRRRMSTVCSISDFQRTRDFKSATSLLGVAVSFVLCQSVKIIPDIYELRNCDYLKVSFNQITHNLKRLLIRMYQILEYLTKPLYNSRVCVVALHLRLRHWWRYQIYYWT